MSINRAPDSVSSITHEKTTVYPVDKIENAGSMSQDETSTTAGAVSPPGSEPEPREDLWWSRMREYGSDFFSEFAGTMVMILFGDGSVAQVTLSENVKGEYQSISWGWG